MKTPEFETGSGRAIEVDAGELDPAKDGEGWMQAVVERLRIATHGYTYRFIGAATGTHPETVRRYLSGGTPCARFIAATCRAFDVSTEWAFSGRGGGPVRAESGVRAGQTSAAATRG